MQAWRKIRETPRYKNKRAQYIEDWEAHHPTSGGNGGASAAGKAIRRSSKAKSKTPQITPDDEAHIQDLVDSEVHFAPSPPYLFSNALFRQYVLYQHLVKHLSAMHAALQTQDILQNYRDTGCDTSATPWMAGSSECSHLDGADESCASPREPKTLPCHVHTS
jgi:hypothetical protein